MDLVNFLATDNPLSFMGKVPDQQKLEQTVFLKAAALSQSYRGGSWRYVAGGQNNVFMAPCSDDVLPVLNASGEFVDLSPDAFGMLATLHSMKALQVGSKYPFLALRFAKLSGLVRKHTEAETIFSCLGAPEGRHE